MSKETIKAVVQELREQVTPVFVSALNSGANLFTDEINEAVKRNGEFPEKFLSSFPDSFKRSTVVAGRELITKGIEQLEKK
ncbi:hypothetical protein [Gracilibacillus salinarum]|uniref:Uncharacterized protein n=1 Tax=Gracilibacillus salinarum TaxID=2932255 RepID=A0ABY4GH69_9BACI|nr:hypothetical protein [Gracilibacillus salinarum]UOQ83665.1 hypothetical protein MUN87_12960 [Gracilibacillus salinarum]